MRNVLHISHTDIQYDSRILKEMTALANSVENYQVVGIGLRMVEGSAISAQALNLEIYSLNLLSRKLTFLPGIVRHILMVLESTVKIFIKAFRLKPEIIHCHDTVVLPLGVLLKYYTKSKLVYDAHELESDRNGLSQTMSKLTLYAEKISWPFIDLLITVSPSIKQWYQDNIGSKVSQVILNSPVLHTHDPKSMLSDENYFREKYNIPEKSKIFIYVGIFGRGRGLEKTLDVFSVVDRESHVIFMGYGDLSDVIRERESKFYNIHFHEAVPHENVVQLIQSADVGLCLIENVSLSDYYCLPNKLFEYCFAGVPVIASNFPDISHTVVKYSLGRCCELTSSSIREAIEDIESNNVSMNINIDDLYALSWGAQEEKLINLYNEVLEIK